MSVVKRQNAWFGISAMAVFLALAPAQGATQRLPPAFGASGSYLAAIVAASARDTGPAAEFYRDALKADPRNVTLLDQAFVAELLDGNLNESFRYAEKTVAREPKNTLARVVLGVRAMRAQDFEKARAHFEQAAAGVRGPDLSLSLFKAFATAGQGNVTSALKQVDRFTDAESKTLRDYFTGLLADVAGRGEEAEKRLDAAHKADSGLMRIADAYSRLLSRQGKAADGAQVLTRWKQENPTQPYLDAHLAALLKGEKLGPLAATPSQGLAEVFYMLAALGQGQRDQATSMIYLQLARHLAPKEDIYTLTLAEFHDSLRQNRRAAELYASIPADSPFGNRAAIGRAAALDRLDKHDEAIGVLKVLLAAHPDDYEAADTLGAILRIKKRWQETIEVYDGALKAIPKLEEKHFVLLFGRAIAYERLKQWPKAEPDFLAALDLLPKKPRNPREAAERAQVMNYLAYSWVDNGMNIEKSFDMLREAVALTPGDGAVVDSLGWAYFRLAKYADAVRELERAVMLKAGDATINDHLGDAYFKVGRVREAEFKWRQSLELNPEPDDAAKTRLKLEKGYDAVSGKGG